jgi:spore photoproduct lyase
VEFKTKWADSKPLRVIEDPSKVVIGFSMNTPRMIEQLESGTSPLEMRLRTARECVQMGFHVAFHFDPMVWYPEWNKEYVEVAERIFDAIEDPEHIAWWSMGGFRTMPALKQHLRSAGRHLPLFSGEMISGEDNKLRYYRDTRVDFYASMREAVERHHRATTLYLCMEIPEVWEQAGMLERIPDGLAAYLDRRAERILGLTDTSAIQTGKDH